MASAALRMPRRGRWVRRPRSRADAPGRPRRGRGRRSRAAGRRAARSRADRAGAAMAEEADALGERGGRGGGRDVGRGAQLGRWRVSAAAGSAGAARARAARGRSPRSVRRTRRGGRAAHRELSRGASLTTWPHGGSRLTSGVCRASHSGLCPAGSPATSSGRAVAPRSSCSAASALARASRTLLRRTDRLPRRARRLRPAPRRPRSHVPGLDDERHLAADAATRRPTRAAADRHGRGGRRLPGLVPPALPAERACAWWAIRWAAWSAWTAPRWPSRATAPAWRGRLRRRGHAGRAGARLQRRRAHQLGLAGHRRARAARPAGDDLDARWRTPTSRHGSIGAPRFCARAGARVLTLADPDDSVVRPEEALLPAPGETLDDLQVETSVTRPGSLGHGAMLDEPAVWHRVLARDRPSGERGSAHHARPARRRAAGAESADARAKAASMTWPTAVRTRVALAVSGHGFGHAVRSAEVAARCSSAGARVVVRTDAPPGCSRTAVEWLPSSGWPLDVGVVQHDGLEFDIDATRARWREFAATSTRAPRAEAHAAACGRRGLRRSAISRRSPSPPRRGPVCPASRSPTSAGTGSTPSGPTSRTRRPRPARLRLRRRLLRLPLHATAPTRSRPFATIEDVPLDRPPRPRDHAIGQRGARPVRGPDAWS